MAFGSVLRALAKQDVEQRKDRRWSRGIALGLVVAVVSALCVLLFLNWPVSRPFVFLNPDGVCVHVNEIQNGQIVPHECGWEKGRNPLPIRVDYNWRPNRN